MTRNLKISGVALAAVLVLGAAMASAASAQVGEIIADGPVTLIGTQTGAASENTLSAFGATTTCANAKYTGHKYDETPHKAAPSGESTFTITPHYGLCSTVPGALPTTIDMNGCDYVLHLEAATGEDEYAARIGVSCPVGQHITITIFATGSEHTKNKPFCHETITENPAGYTGLKAKDTTNGFIDVSGKIAGISIDKKSPSGSILCPEETTAVASLTQDLTLEGKNEIGEATPISFVNVITPPKGVIIADGPVTLIGTQTGAASENTLSAFGATTTCANAKYTGHKYDETPHKAAPSGESTFTITPHYGLCSTVPGALPTTIDMNGCDYVLHLEAATGEDEYGVKATTICPVGQHITITIFATGSEHTKNKPFCHETITENPAGYTGLKAKDTTNGFIDVSGKIAGISIDKKSPSGSILCPEETTAVASLTQDLTLEGKDEAGESTPISFINVITPPRGRITSTGPVTLIGTQTGAASENTLIAFGGTTTCVNAKYTGHKYNETPHRFIPNNVSVVTVTPHYGVCQTLVGGSSFPVTVDMNGCDYVLHLGETAGVDTYNVKSTVVCPVGKHITVTLFITSAKHTTNEPFCHYTITENAAGYTGLTAEDTTNGKIDVKGIIGGISIDKKSPTSSIVCPEETTNAASLVLDITVEGKNEAGATTSISLSHL